MKKVMLAIATLALVACGGGGGNGDGAPSLGLTHNQLADLFVTALNSTGAYDVSLAKSSTLHDNFIVIYDYDLQEYDAVNISGWTPGTDPAVYVDGSYAIAYYDLDVLPAHYEYDYDVFGDLVSTWIPTRYQDYYTGYVFEKTGTTSKDLLKLSALAEEEVVGNRAEAVATKFGLSVDRSKEVVRLAMAWKKAGGKDLTAKDQDSFSQEMLGFSITEAKSAVKQNLAGDTAALDSLVEKAAETNETTPENVRQIISTYIK
jgi:hypothetical protein